MPLMKRKILFLVISFMTITAISCGNSRSINVLDAPCSETDPTVSTLDGPICGALGSGGYPDESTQKQVWSYKGIPYAATTGGNNRWLAAKDPAPWTVPLSGKQFGHICTQLVEGAVSGSEDCLFVNVFTPSAPGAAGSALPVMVFIHGGAYYMGSSSQVNYDGSNMAGGGNVVVVTINYRLGVLGFLGGFGTGDAVDGNLGLKDQQKALQWVQDNIAAFGGDPGNVTIFGLSAGASSVGVHLVNGVSKGLFSRAIMQSNHYGMRFQTRNTANRRAGKLAKALGCSSGSEDDKLACMRTAADTDIDTFMKTAGPSKIQQGLAILCDSFGGSEYWAPMVDGNFVEKQPIDTVIDKPFMTGTLRDEGVYFISLAGQYPKLLPGALILLSETIFGVIPGGRIYATYVSQNKSDFLKNKKGKIAAKLLTDYVFHCANNRVMNASVNAGNNDIYGYYFTHQPTISIYNYMDTTKKSPGYFCSPGQGTVCHANDIPYTFGTPIGFNTPGTDTASWIGFQQEELKMSGDIMRYWTGFATNGAPDSGGSFPKFSPQGLPDGTYLRIAAASEGGIVPTSDLYDEANCKLLSDVGWEQTWVQETCTEWPSAEDALTDSD